MSSRPWGDHLEHRLTMTRIPDCDGRPAYEGGTDQSRYRGGGCVSFNDGDFHLPVGKLAEFVTTLYEAAGLPAPVILDRPAATFADGVNRAGRFEVGRLNGRVTVGLYGVQPEEIEPGQARRLAALIAIRADEAESEPDPAEVEKLAAVVHQAGCCTCDNPAEFDRDVARAALRWFRDRHQRGEDHDG